MQNFEMLRSEARQYLGLSVSPDQAQLLRRYADLLAEWNQKINLTAIRTTEDIRIKHFLDSLSCLLAIEGRSISRLIDVGTGAGFPGLPIKVLLPEIHLTLVESVAKKTKFLTHVVQELDLNGVEVINARAEVIGRKTAHREKYDWAVARAVANLPVLCEYLLPLVKIGGYMLAQKGESTPAELEQAQPSLELLGGRFSERIPVELPGVPQERSLVVIQKTSPTPEKYPRRDGVPSKRPIGN